MRETQRGGINEIPAQQSCFCGLSHTHTPCICHAHAITPAITKQLVFNNVLHHFSFVDVGETHLLNRATFGAPSTGLWMTEAGKLIYIYQKHDTLDSVRLTGLQLCDFIALFQLSLPARTSTLQTSS